MCLQYPDPCTGHALDFVVDEHALPNSCSECRLDSLETLVPHGGLLRTASSTITPCLLFMERESQIVRMRHKIFQQGHVARTERVQQISAPLPDLDRLCSGFRVDRPTP